MTAPTWRKACHASNQCVEIAASRHPLSGWAWTLLRDGKHPDGPQLALLWASWAAVIRDIKARP